ncbi:MAG: 2-amino-4-hydroxy-6-hydroxymethyldihydropteridine diphosphokinase [Gammaproteobacteria bacterium]
MAEHEIYLSIGSNIAPERHIPAALAALEAAYGPLVVSPWYRSAPVGFEGPDFINGVVRGRTGDGFARLRERLKRLERRAGRDQSKRLATRELDLDLLLFGDEIIEEDDFAIPRPDILEYAFVLRPLAEMAPEATHPATGRSFAWHWRHFMGEQIALESVSLEGNRA